MTASTTSGLVERIVPPMGLTLMPTTSLGPTNWPQALPGSFSPVSAAMPAWISLATRAPSIFCPTGLAPVPTLTTFPGYFPGRDVATLGMPLTSSILVLMSAGGAAGGFSLWAFSWPNRRGATTAPAAATAAVPKNFRRENLSDGQASFSPVRVKMSSLRMGPPGDRGWDDYRPGEGGRQLGQNEDTTIWALIRCDGAHIMTVLPHFPDD